MFLLSLWLLASSDGVLAGDLGPRLPDVASACVACGSTAPRPEELISQDLWSGLRSGEVLKRQGERLVGPDSLVTVNRAFGWIEHPPDRVWEVLTAFEDWPSFMPHVTATEVVSRAGAELRVQQNYRILLASLQHTTVYQSDAASGRLAWHLDETAPHDIAATRGAWQLAPVDGGKATLVAYTSSVDTGRDVPAFVERMLVDRSLSVLFEQIRGEVQRRQTAR